MYYKLKCPYDNIHEIARYLAKVSNNRYMFNYNRIIADSWRIEMCIDDFCTNGYKIDKVEYWNLFIDGRTFKKDEREFMTELLLRWGTRGK